MSSSQDFQVSQISLTFHDRVYNPPFIEKPITKIALTAFAFLFAAGALISHFTGVGTIGVAAFGAGSGVCVLSMIVVALCTVCSKRQKEPEERSEPPQRPGGFVPAIDVESDGEPESYDPYKTNPSHSGNTFPASRSGYSVMPTGTQ